VIALQNELSSRQETQIQPYLILCIIDGNSFLFRPDLLSQGLPGGRQAALSLSEHIADFFSLQGFHALDQVSFWMTIYHSRPLLLDMALRHRLCTKDQLEAFFHGFSMTSPRFSVVDVGDSKGCVSAKLTGGLSSFVQPFTLLIAINPPPFRARQNIHTIFPDGAGFPCRQVDITHPLHFTYMKYSRRAFFRRPLGSWQQKAPREDRVPSKRRPRKWFG
jgi:hypothetical protein